jgi:hypothetical protein
MCSRLEQVIERLFKHEQYHIVDGILDSIEIERTGNNFTDLIDIIVLCKPHSCYLPSFAWFKRTLVEKIFKERGEEGRNLIKKVME